MLIQPDLLKLDYGLRSVGLEQTEDGQESQNYIGLFVTRFS